MKRLTHFAQLTWRHDFWSLLRYYRSLRLRSDKQASWLADLMASSCLPDQPKKFPIKPELIGYLRDYLPQADVLLQCALKALRTEEEAMLFCQNQKSVSSPIIKSADRSRFRHSGRGVPICKDNSES